MGRFDDLKKLKEAAAAKLSDENLGVGLARAAGDAVIGMAEVAQGAEAVAARGGLTNGDGDLSKSKLARAALRPGKTARTLLDAAADEIRTRRQPGESED